MINFRDRFISTVSGEKKLMMTLLALTNSAVCYFQPLLRYSENCIILRQINKYNFGVHSNRAKYYLLSLKKSKKKCATNPWLSKSGIAVESCKAQEFSTVKIGRLTVIVLYHTFWLKTVILRCTWNTHPENAFWNSFLFEIKETSYMVGESKLRRSWIA